VKAFFVVLALLIVFPVSAIIGDSVGEAYAAENGITKKTREKTARGLVKVVDPAAKAIVIKGKDEFIFIAEESLLMDIKLNDKVTIRYKEAGGKKYAHSIKVDQKKKGKGRQTR
jgi:hypothetical protein